MDIHFHGKPDDTVVTDGQTDAQTMAKTREALYALARKNK